MVWVITQPYVIRQAVILTRVVSRESVAALAADSLPVNRADIAPDTDETP
jgi:hypothetical protein